MTPRTAEPAGPPTSPADRRLVVVVQRDDRGWQTHTATLGVIRASSLFALSRRIRELVGRQPVDYQFHTGDAELDRLVLQIQAAQAEVRRHRERARALTLQVLRLPGGGTLRDLGLLVGLSYQRVHQLMRQVHESDRA